MKEGEPPLDTLEALAVAGRRAYLDALVACEQARHALTCRYCRPPDVSTDSQKLISARLDAEAERLRLALREIYDALGFIPSTGADVLPDEDHADRACRRPR